MIIYNLTEMIMKITRELAILTLKYCCEHPDFYFPFFIMCREYSLEDNDFVEVCPNEWENIQDDEMYQTFELWEKLQDIRENTTELLAKRFIDKIVGENKIRKFIFLTFEGFTEDPKGKEIENIQMIGIGIGRNSQEAFEYLKKNNSWIFETSFYEVYCQELLDNKYEYFHFIKKKKRSKKNNLF